MADETNKNIVYKKRQHFQVPLLNKGARAKALLTGRFELFAKLAAHTYTLLGNERYKGVVMSQRLRFTSHDEVEGEKMLVKYANTLPPARRGKKSHEKTARERIRDAILAGVPCYEFGWYLPDEGPELDQSFFLALSFITRHRIKPTGLTSLLQREGDEHNGTLRDRRFIWTENDEENRMGLTILGSCDLWFPDRQYADDCLIFVPEDPTAGNFVKSAYDLLVRSGQLKDVTNYLAACRTEVEELEEVGEEEAAQPPVEEQKVAERGTRRRKAGESAPREMVDQTNHGGRRTQEESDSAADFPKEAIKKATPKPEKKSEVQPREGFKPVWRWCTNLNGFEGGGKKGQCPEYHTPVFSADPAPKCETCGKKLATPAKRDSKKFDEARSRLKIDLGFDPEEKWEADHESANPPSEEKPAEVAPPAVTA